MSGQTGDLPDCGNALSELADARRVLVCLHFGIGDLIMQFPALDALRRHCIGSAICAVGARPAIQLLRGESLVDRVVTYHDFGLRHWGDPGSPAAVEQIIAWVERERFDAVLDPFHAVIGFREAIGRARHVSIFETGHGLQDRFLQEEPCGQAAVNRAAWAGWGVPAGPEQAPFLQLRPGERAAADAILSNSAGEAGTGFYAFSPVASSTLKRWPRRPFAEVVRRILDTSTGHALIMGGEDGATAHDLADAVGAPGRVSVLPAMHLRTAAAVLARCRALVCNDTGLMHLAAAVGTPTVAVFGPTCRTIYCPPAAQGVAPDLACDHRQTTVFGPPACVLHDRCLVGLRSCIDLVQPEDVVAAIERLERAPLRTHMNFMGGSDAGTGTGSEPSVGPG